MTNAKAARPGERTWIGALADSDGPEKNIALAECLRHAVEHRADELRHYGFVFTGGTFRRLFLANPGQGNGGAVLDVVDPSGDTKRYLLKQCGVICLPDGRNGGVTLLAALVTRGVVSILWPFFRPWSDHVVHPENNALWRLCDHWHVKKLMNKASVIEWVNGESRVDRARNLQPTPFSYKLIDGRELIPRKPVSMQGAGRSRLSVFRVGDPSRTAGKAPDWGLLNRDETLAAAIETVRRAARSTRIALISHDEKKERMQEFATDYQNELARFKKIMTTGTTGTRVGEVSEALKENIQKFHSGPLGGDIEIAVEILHGTCHVVFFFVDPLHPHAHADDIRVVFQACMTNERILMMSTEQQAREWMNRVVRRTGRR